MGGDSEFHRIPDRAKGRMSRLERARDGKTVQRVALDAGLALENPHPERGSGHYLPQNSLLLIDIKTARLESCLPLFTVKGVSSVRNLGPALLLVLILAGNSFAAPTVAKSSVFPEPGLLALLGGGLVGLATLIRRHLGD